MWLLGFERERAEGEAATKRVLFTTIIVAAGAAREARGRPGAFPTAEEEGRDFLLNSCLIKIDTSPLLI